MDQEEKVHENRVRRMADRQRFALHKSRRRDPRAHDYGEMWLREIDAPDEAAEHRGDAWRGPFFTLAEVEKFLSEAPVHRWPGRYVRQIEGA